MSADMFFDGWYVARDDAEAVLRDVAAKGAIPIGIVEGNGGTFGLLYMSSKVLFYGHRLEKWLAYWRQKGSA